MSRPLRIEYPGAWYHVMNRGRRREKIYLEENDYKLFLKILDQVSKLFTVEIHSYALMPNHYHLLIHTPKGNLSRVMRHINAAYTQGFNKRHKIDGSLFRGRYKSILIEEQKYLLELIRYIHKNPINSNMENKLGQYKWCSHRGYIKMAEKENFLITEHVLSKFDKNEKVAQKQLVKFINKKVSEDLRKKLGSHRWPLILGSDGYKEEMKKMLEDKKIELEELPDLKKYFKKTRDDENESKVKKLIELNKEALTMKRIRKYTNHRKAVVYVLRRIYGKSLREISKYFINISYAGISKMYLNGEKEIEKGQGCFAEYENIKKELKFKVQT